MEGIFLASVGEPLRQSKALPSRKPSLSIVQMTIGCWWATASHNVTCNSGLLGTVPHAVNEGGLLSLVHLTRSFSATLPVRTMFRAPYSSFYCMRVGAAAGRLGASIGELKFGGGAISMLGRTA